MPISLHFESPAEAKGFNALVTIDDKNVEIAKGITGTIEFKNLAVQCLAVYGCLLRKEELGFSNTPTSKSRLYLPSFNLPEHPAHLRRA